VRPLAINRPMLAFVKALGFGVSVWNDPTTRRVLLGRRIALSNSSAAYGTDSLTRKAKGLGQK
jgi:hypothetical protein